MAAKKEEITKLPKGAIALNDRVVELLQSTTEEARKQLMTIQNQFNRDMDRILIGIVNQIGEDGVNYELSKDLKHILPKEDK